MRIVGIEITDHPGIGDLAIDFRGSDGSAPKHIVLAGSNGCGKTAILGAIFSAIAPYSFVRHNMNFYWSGRALVLIEISGVNADIQLNSPITPELFEARKRWSDFSGIAVEVDHSSDDRNRWYHKIINFRNNTLEGHNSKGRIFGTEKGCFLSEANVVFDVSPVKSITTTNIEQKLSNEHGGVNLNFPIIGSGLSNQIPQLFVDLQNADANDALLWARENVGSPVNQQIVDIRVNRFKQAFDNLMVHKKYSGIEIIDGEHRPYFEDAGKRTPIGRLSTGEKQVVFRGAFLLRQAEHMPGAVVLIDEPELSLHPIWQAGVLDYYDKIVNETEDKKSQIILATHSPYVVHGSPTAKHVVLKRDQSGNVIVDSTPSYPGVTSEEVAVAAFDLSNSVFSGPGNRMVVVTEGRTDAEILRSAWTHLRPGQPMRFNLMSAGGAKSVRAFLGAEADTTGPLMDALGDAQIDRFLALFDFDREGYEQWNGMITTAKAEIEDLTAPCPFRKRRGARVWAALLPVPSFRPGYAGFGQGLKSRSRLTIELLFEDANVRHLLAEEEIPAAPGAFVLVAPDSQKAAIAAAAATWPASAFVAFEPIFQMIETVLAAP